MRRRGTVNRKPAKTQHRKPTRPKRSNAAMATNQVNSPVGDLQEQLDRRTRELSEALEQQAATSEVLSVISSSPRDLDPVFKTMLENAVRICDAKFGYLQLNESGAFRMVAMYNVPRPTLRRLPSAV